jgi:hypothetical protein
MVEGVSSPGVGNGVIGGGVSGTGVSSSGVGDGVVMIGGAVAIGGEVSGTGFVGGGVSGTGVVGSGVSGIGRYVGVCVTTTGGGVSGAGVVVGGGGVSGTGDGNGVISGIGGRVGGRSNGPVGDNVLFVPASTAPARTSSSRAIEKVDRLMIMLISFGQRRLNGCQNRLYFMIGCGRSSSVSRERSLVARRGEHRSDFSRCCPETRGRGTVVGRSERGDIVRVDNILVVP